MREKDAIESALQRITGSNEQSEDVKKVWAEWHDWTGTCPRCHAVLKGTMAELKAHVCPEGTPPKPPRKPA